MTSRAADTTATERAPDFVIALDADERTADAARYCVGTIARTAPAARGRAELLTGALLAGATSARQAHARRRARRDSHPVQLRVWSSADPARVELAGPPELANAAPLLDGHADRWGVERDAVGTRVWFEVDAGESDEQTPDGLRGSRAAQPV